MNMNGNYIDKLFMTAINGICETEWKWPMGWDIVRKKRFLKQCLEYAERNELYEQCAIIRDVEKETTE